jgi:hypothetical protein
LRRDFRNFVLDLIDASESCGESALSKRKNETWQPARVPSKYFSSIWDQRKSNRSCDALP